MSPLQLIRDLNTAWSTGDLADIGAFYHPDAVLLPPDAGEPIQGRGAIASTYIDFAAMTDLKQFSIIDLSSYPIGDNTAVHLRFEVDYVMDGEHYLESGLEVYWVDTTPLVIWRYQTVLSTRTL